MRPYTLGLDIGIASVGWCLLGEDHIIDLGVRAFDKAETAKEGDPLNLTRRMARLTRHRLAQRAWRLKKLTRELKRHGLIDDQRFFQPTNPTAVSPWQLRVQGLDRKLERDEWARVIYHLCKHRGFHWVSRAEKKKAESDTKSETGKLKPMLDAIEQRAKNYRSAAEMLVTEDPQTQRNKQGAYTKALSRELLANEFKLLFECQRKLENPYATSDIELTILGNGDEKSGLFWQQKPAITGQQMFARLGRCSFERKAGPDGKGEYRAPKCSFTAERHVWLTRLNNLRVVVNGQTRPLTETERALALPLPYQRAGDFKYEHLRTALTKAGLLPKDGFKFAGLAYPSDKQKTEGKAKDPESAVLAKLTGWRTLRTTLKAACLETEWEGLAGSAIDGRPEILDQIANVLSIYKDDDEARRELAKLALPNTERMVEAMLDIRFDKFHALSLKALYKIVPLMDKGLRYDEAIAAIPDYGHHSQLYKAGEGQHRTLPPLYAGRDKDGRMVFADDADIPRNPVVLRALNQARKVVNAIIRRYGSPMAVNIEMARDLSRPLQGHWTDNGKYIEGRRDIEKAQQENRARNEKDWEEFKHLAISLGLREPADKERHGREFIKWQLYREQDAKCAYSLEPLDVERLLERGYVEIDHVLPFSRSYDNSKNNRVLVLKPENQNKRNRTPYEYLTSFDGGEEGTRWQRFVAFVENNPKYRQAKKGRLLRKHFGEKEAEEFKERNLNDTRYICRFFKNYIERHLKLAEGSDAKRCVVLSGQMTAFLRARWGINKIRSESDRHHALDAAVVAACTHSMVKRLADYAQNKELAQIRGGFVDAGTGEIVGKQHFPEPWPHFHYELEARLKIDEPALLREEMARLGSYDESGLAALRPLFVSRAVQKRGTGAVHAETIRSAKALATSKSYVKTPLEKLKLSALQNIVGADDPRNKALINLIAKRLEDFGDDGKKAFAIPLRKPAKDGKGPVVKTVKVFSTQKTGMLIRGGVADLGDMLAVGVFKAGKHYLIEPEYLASTKARISSVAIPPDAEFLFYLRKNDYLEIKLGDETYRGYFVMYESDGRLTLRAHDQSKPDKEYFRRSVANAQEIQKYHVDLLGNIHPAKPEPRRGLA